MKRVAVVIAGALAGMLAVSFGVFALARAWPGLAGLSATAVARPATTEPAEPTLAPSPTPPSGPGRSPTDAVPWLRELDSSSLPSAGSVRELTGALPLTRAAVQQPFEELGFDFQHVQLGDGREHWVASSPDGLALVDVVGSQAVTRASVSVFGPIRPAAVGAGPRAVYVLTLLQTILPDWPEGSEWFADQLASAARRGGDYEAETSHQGVRVVFSADVQSGSMTLSFEPHR